MTETIYLETDDLKTKTEKLNKLLLHLAKSETDKTLRVAIKDACRAIRHKTVGFTIKEIRAAVRDLLEEYFCLEMADLVELSGINENQLSFCLQTMEEEGLIIRGKRRRWNEAGKHYNEIFELVK